MATAAQTMPIRAPRHNGDTWSLQFNAPNYDDLGGARGHAGLSYVLPIATTALLGAWRVVTGGTSSAEGFTQVVEILDARPETPTTGLAFAAINADHDAVVERISEVGKLRMQVEARLSALAELQPGWLDGDGVAPAKRAVDHARSVIPHLLNLSVPRPRIAATPEGGVEAEWSIGVREVSVTFEPDGALHGMAVDIVTHEVTEPVLDISDRGAIADFVLGQE